MSLVLSNFFDDILGNAPVAITAHTNVQVYLKM